MALISCPECSKEVSNAAASCPSCGHPIQGVAHTPPRKWSPGDRIKDQRQAPNTALHLLVDLSGSMARGQDCIALDAAMALALALEPIQGVSTAVSAFPSTQGQDTQVTRLLGHTERVASHAGAFVQRARGGTPMTGALWYAAADLLARTEDRKVLLTLTDGVPNDVPSALDLINRAAQAGIELHRHRHPDGCQSICSQPRSASTTSPT